MTFVVFTDKKGCKDEMGTGGTAHLRKSEKELQEQLSYSILFKNSRPLSPAKEPKGISLLAVVLMLCVDMC
jgi:hypothetical protein